MSEAWLGKSFWGVFWLLGAIWGIFGVRLPILNERSEDSVFVCVSVYLRGDAKVDDVCWCDKKRPLLSNVYAKAIILPRQARDKHRETLRKERRFSQAV